MSFAAFDRFRKGGGIAQSSDGASSSDSNPATPTKQTGLSSAPQPAKILQDVLGNYIALHLSYSKVLFFPEAFLAEPWLTLSTIY